MYMYISFIDRSNSTKFVWSRALYHFFDVLAHCATTPTTTTSATVPTVSEARYTIGYNDSPGVHRTSLPMGDISLLRADTFATGTPTQAGCVPPYSEPFSFMGHQSLMNMTRTAHSSVRDLVATSSAGGSPRDINSPFETPITSMSIARQTGHFRICRTYRQMKRL